MYCGVVPQHPPTIFKSFSWKKGSIFAASVYGVSSYTPSSFGSPAFGYTEIYVSETLFRVFRNCVMNSGPVAQFNPIDSGFM